MDGLKEIRLQLNMSQYDLAQFLRVPRSSIAMCETGQRDLPRRAWRRFFELLAQVPEPIGQMELPADPSLESQVAASRKLLEKSLRNIKFFLFRHRHKLKQLEAAHLQSLEALGHMLKYAENIPAQRDENSDVSIQIDTETYINLPKSGLYEQTKLKMRIGALEGEKEMIEQLLSGLPLPVTT